MVKLIGIIIALFGIIKVQNTNQKPCPTDNPSDK